MFAHREVLYLVHLRIVGWASTHGFCVAFIAYKGLGGYGSLRTNELRLWSFFRVGGGVVRGSEGNGLCVVI